MLPLLNGKRSNNSGEFQATQIKLYNPPKQLMSMQQSDRQRKPSIISSSRAHQKLKIMSGYRKSQNPSQSFKKDSLINPNLKPSMDQNYSTLNYHSNKQFTKLSSTKDLSAEIKLIQKKIRYHQKKIDQEKKRKEQESKNDPYQNDFQKIIRKEMQNQGYQEDKGFDYLTNPNKLSGQDEQPLQPPVEQVVNVPAAVIVQKKFSITSQVQKLQKHYQHSLKKKFQRRELFPHFACKRKTPKLYITTQTNTLQKFGKKPAQQQHLFRIMTKQCTPQQIYPTIPNFAVVKDSLARNVIAYLGEYKPFIDRTKDEADPPNDNHNIEQNLLNGQPLPHDYNNA